MGRSRGERDRTFIVGRKHGDGVVDGRIRTAADEEEGRPWVSSNLGRLRFTFLRCPADLFVFLPFSGGPTCLWRRSFSFSFITAFEAKVRLLSLHFSSTRLSSLADSSFLVSHLSDHLFSQTFFACYRRFSRPQDVIALFVSEFQLLEGKKLAGVYAQLK